MAGRLVSFSRVGVTKKSLCFGLSWLRSQRDQMFVDHPEPDELPRSVRAKHLATEERISLLRSEAVLINIVSSINISPLRGEAICV